MQPGQVIADRYRIEQLIGEGGIGRVYSARDLHTRETLAIKCLRPEFAKDSRVRRRFMREGRAVARLAHPHIVRLFACGEAADTPFIAMELIEGTPLSDHRDQGLHLDTLLAIVDQTLSALAFAHARGVVHRDVKPENILVSWVDRGRRPFVKLLDFGFARVEDDQDVKLTQAHGDAFGTPLYMAPEQAQARGNVGPETDLYAMGVILFEFLSGHPPFTGAHGMAVALKHVMEAVPPLTARAGLIIPLGLEDVVSRALEKDPRNRWRTAADMRRAISSFLSRGAVPPSEDESEDQTMAGPGQAQMGGTVPPAPRTFDEAPVSDATMVNVFGNLRTGNTGAHVGLLLPVLEPEPSRGGFEAALAANPDAQALVGREPDMLWLWERAGEVCEKAAGRIVLLSGPPGMGKRRLLGWLTDQVGEGGWMVPITPAAQTAKRQANRTDLRGLVASLFGQLPVDRRSAETAILHGLSRWASMPAPWPAPEPAMLGVLAATLAAWLTPATGTIVGEDVAEIRGDVLFGRTLELFQLAARERPLLLALESIEAVGPETGAFVAWLARWLRRIELPILVVVGFTVDEAGQPRYTAAAGVVQAILAVGGQEIESRTLGPLDAEAVKQLLTAIAPMEPAVAEAIARRTRGNPYFARELALWASQAGELAEERGVMVLSKQARPQSWPSTLTDTLLLRTDESLRRKSNADTARNILECSALLGEEFEYEVLVQFMTRAIGNRAEVESGVEVLLQLGIFGESGTMDGDHLHLTHDALHNALLDRLAAHADVAALHRMAAETLCALSGRETGPVAEEIARHFEHGGLPVEAADQYLAAAIFKRDVGQVNRACELLEAADTLLAQFSGAEIDLKRAGGWLDLGELELRRGQMPRARTLAGRVYAWARQNGQPLLEGRALLLVSDLFRRQGHLAEAGRGYAQARTVFERAQERKGYARSLLGAAMVERSLGRNDAAVELFELARQAMESAGDHHGLARAWRGQGEIALRLNELAAARDRLELARQAYSTAGDTSGVTYCHWLLGETYRLLGQPDLAVSHFEATRRGAEALQDDTNRGRAHLSLARLYRDRGLWPDAEGNFEVAVQCYESLGDAARAAGARSELGMGALSQRRFDAALQNLGAAVAHMVQAGDQERVAVLRASLAWIHAEQGDEAQAEPELRHAMEFDAVKPLLDPDYARALEGIAEVDTYLGRRLRAARLLGRAAEIHLTLGQAGEADRLQRKVALLVPRGIR